MATILLVEDKERMARMLEEAIRAEGHQTLWARDGRQGLEALKGQKVDLVLTDLKLPNISGFEVLESVKASYPLIPVILMTAYGSIEGAVKAVRNGAYDFLTKPFDPDHLLILIEKALEKRRLVTENLILKEQCSNQHPLPCIVGRSPGIRGVEAQVQKVAVGRSTVLLLGESGTGKELFARAIHSLSPRRESPMVAINCAAITRDLLESELFGHERGAFTGAIERRMGKFELAHGGTIFLDEIGDMDPALQAKLLRVLEGKEFMRVGGTTRVQVDVRVVAATNKNLQAAIEQRTFREDLFYRLSVFPISIPPLRERREDIPVLTDYFMEYYCRQSNKGKMTLSQDALELLVSHAWKGNVRELQNTIERAIILCDQEVIHPEHLGIRVRTLQEDIVQTFPLNGTLHEVSAQASRIAESRLIRKVLRETGGNKSKAAQILQVSYKTLLTKIKDYLQDAKAA